MAIWHNIWPFGIFVVNLVYFPRFGKYSQEKSGNPGFSPPTFYGKRQVNPISPFFSFLYLHRPSSAAAEQWDFF
jgi:hypothetical protein